MRNILPLLLTLGCPLTSKTEQPEDFSTCDGDDGYGVSIGGLDTASPALSIEGDTLTVMVGYGGGCEEHLFSICWPDATFLESAPVQVNLEIWHGGKADMCDAYFTGPVTFDLSPLKAAWKEAYGDSAGTIILNISGADESVEYSFE